MITRIWHGEIRSSQADEYVEYIRETGASDLQATPGNLGVMVLRRAGAERADVLVVSFWRELSDIRAFAGDDVERARYYSKDRRYLLHLERKVRQYEVPIAHVPAIVIE